MFHLTTATIGLLVALVATFVAARDQLRKPASTTPILAGVMFLAVILSVMARTPPSFYYKGSVTLALLIAAIATVFMVIEGTPLIVRSGANTIVYFILWLGFLVTAGRAFWTLPALLAFAIGLVAYGALFLIVRKRLKWLALTVLLYALNAAMVVGGAAALLVVRPALWSVLALIGAVFLTGADVVAAQSTWRSPLRNDRLYQTLLIALGAILLAVSVWGDALTRLWPIG